MQNRFFETFKIYYNKIYILAEHEVLKMGV